MICLYVTISAKNDVQFDFWLPLEKVWKVEYGRQILNFVVDTIPQAFKHLYRNLLYIWVPMWVSYKKQELLPFISTWVHIQFYGEIRVAHCVSFFLALSHYLSLRSDFGVVMSVTISATTKKTFISSLSPVVCRSDHVLFTLFVFACA